MDHTGATQRPIRCRHLFARCTTPEPQSIVAARAEYSVWHAGLRILAEELRGKLQTIAILPHECRKDWHSPANRAFVSTSAGVEALR